VLGSVNRYSHYHVGSLGRAVYPPPHVLAWIVTTLWLVGCIVGGGHPDAGLGSHDQAGGRHPGRAHRRCRAAWAWSRPA